MVQGDMHQPHLYPRERYDMIASITVSPEMANGSQLRAFGRHILHALKQDGYWLDEGIDPADEIAQQFPLDPNAPVESRAGRVVLWQYGDATKPERVLSLPDAIAMYRSLGGLVMAGRVVIFEDDVFAQKKVMRRFTQLIVQKPSKQETFAPASLTHTKGHLLPGLTNKVELVADSKGKRYVRKTILHGPRGTEGLVHHLATEELIEVGFLQPGNAASDTLVYGRTGPEQQALCKHLDKLGIAAAVPVYADTNTLVIPHIPGQTLWEHLQEGKTSAIPKALQSLHRAHTYAIYAGEPWAGNFIVTEDESNVVRLDPEIAIAGKTSAELEMAQLLYAIFSLTTTFDDSLTKAAAFAREHATHYDWPQIQSYIKAYQRYFSPGGKGQHLERAKHQLKHSQLRSIESTLGT